MYSLLTLISKTPFFFKIDDGRVFQKQLVKAVKSLDGKEQNKKAFKAILCTVERSILLSCTPVSSLRPE